MNTTKKERKKEEEEEEEEDDDDDLHIHLQREKKKSDNNRKRLPTHRIDLKPPLIQTDELRRQNFNSLFVARCESASASSSSSSFECSVARKNWLEEEEEEKKRKGKKLSKSNNVSSSSSSSSVQPIRLLYCWRNLSVLFCNECVACWSFKVLICSAEEVCMAAAAAPAAVYRAGGRGG
jgi:hypothetical protein